MEVRAQRSISQGEEISTRYIVPTMEQPARLAYIHRTWGFVCSCARWLTKGGNEGVEVIFTISQVPVRHGAGVGLQQPGVRRLRGRGSSHPEAAGGPRIGVGV